MVEADYPNSPFMVGDVLELSDTTTLNGQTVYYKKYPPIHLDVDMLKDYPHIFRPMHWSEQRELGEMPIYLRRVNSGKWVVKAHKYRFIYGNWWVVPEWAKKVGYDSIVTDYLPATEAEYFKYLKSKNNESI